MHNPGDHNQPGFLESTRRFCSLFGEWVCGLTIKQLAELFKSSSSGSHLKQIKEEEDLSDSMDTIDISSSDSDFNLDSDSDNEREAVSAHEPAVPVYEPYNPVPQPEAPTKRVLPNWKFPRDEGSQMPRPRVPSGSGSARHPYAGHRSPAESSASTSYGTGRGAGGSSSHCGGNFRIPKGNGNGSQSTRGETQFHLNLNKSSHAPDGAHEQQPGKRALPASLQPCGLRSKHKSSWDDLDSTRSGADNGLYHPVELSAANSRNHAKDGFSKGSDYDSHMYDNNRPRTLPQTFMRGKSAPSAHLTSSSDPLVGMGYADQRVTGDERVIYQAALRDLNQPRKELDVPDGVLSVPLLRHQKIALSWMVDQEASAFCLGGILADDQGLGKTISTIALIQKQKLLLRQSQSEKQGSCIAEALDLDDDDDDDKEKKTGDAICKSGQNHNIKPETLILDDDDLGNTSTTSEKVKKEEVKEEEVDVDKGKKICDVLSKSGQIHNIKPETLILDDDDHGNAPTTSGKIKKEVDVLKCSSGASSSRQSSLCQTLTNSRPPAGTLIVCPATVLRQWARELDDKVSEGEKLSVLIYHGGNRTKDPYELAKYDVVLTTYSIVSNEVPKQPLVDEDDAEQILGEKSGVSPQFTAFNKRKFPSSSGKKGKKGRKLSDSSFYNEAGTLAKVRWSRVVLDEAQTIKNHRTQTARACCGLKAKTRWCLSGTPIQNCIDELYSYFRFLRHHPYSDYKLFCEQIKFPITKDPVVGYKKLQIVLKTLLLRRTKGTLLDGEPIINLPPKFIKMKSVNFTAEERAFYAQLEADSRSQFKAYSEAGTVNQNYANILLMILRLRQACDHPLLVKGFNSEPARRTSLEKARKLSRQTLMKLLYCLETSSAICGLCSDPAEDSVVTICGHVFCYQCVGDYLTGDDTMCPARRCKEQLTEDVLFSEATLRTCLSSDVDSHLLNDNDRFKNSSILSSEYSSSKIKAALQILQSHSSGPCVEPICLEDEDVENSVCAQVRTVKVENSSSQGPIKTIIFSQWTRMLDLLEWSLNQHCIQYRRLDGSMSLAARDRAVREFNSDPEVTVMVMSLKAGNLGLNMVAACHVILLDLWWNPTTEDQAIDRAHRIGQTRPVTVSRITIKDSIEDRILALQEEKRKMVASAFGEDHVGASGARLTAEDIRYLFLGERDL